MRTAHRWGWGAGLLVLVGSVTGAWRATAPQRAQHAMAAAAMAFLETLDAGGRAATQYPFDAPERFDWHFVPRQRSGLAFRDMTPNQRVAAHRLIQSAMSAAGYLKVTGVIHLERILGVLENRPDRRDPEDYHLWVFGDPSTPTPWGWRFEGHHLSINFTSVTSELVAATPSFLGANPATVPSGPFTGLRVLGAEEDLGRALVRMLSDGQRARAVIATAAPRDIITRNDRRVSIDGFEGLPVSAMTDSQRTALLRLVDAYVGNMTPDVAAAQMEKIRRAGLDRLHFAWAGPLEEGRGHYYRIHGPTVLIEYDNTQNDANHVHSVWRDLTDDFGEDLLRRHYEEADHHEP